jgi:spore coat polysaccharide biosynthesis protein SpsF
MGSNRFPGKVLEEINGAPLLQWLLERVENSKLTNDVVVATTTSRNDDQLVEWLRANGYSYSRGSENDVLERFYNCQKQYNPDYIVRLTADDPLKDAEIIDKAISLIIANPKIDYCSNSIEPSYPDGLDVEVFKREALEEANAKAMRISEREHVTSYIWNHPQFFNLLNFKYEEDLSEWRWTIDELSDINFIKKLTAPFSNDRQVSYKILIKYLKDNIDLLKINSGHIKNYAYFEMINRELDDKK